MNFLKDVQYFGDEILPYNFKLLIPDKMTNKEKNKITHMKVTEVERIDICQMHIIKRAEYKSGKSARRENYYFKETTTQKIF